MRARVAQVGVGALQGGARGVKALGRVVGEAAVAGAARRAASAGRSVDGRAGQGRGPGRAVQGGTTSQAPTPRHAASGSDAPLEREFAVSRGEVSLSFVHAPRTGTLRVIDFRAGHQDRKLDVVLDAAESRGARRVFTVVEREEVSTWARLGFQKEGVLPGFYKRSDGHILGLAVSSGERTEHQHAEESVTRLRIHGDDASDRADRAVALAKKRLRSRATESTPVKLQVARQQDVVRALEVAREGGRDLGDFSPFGRDPEFTHYLLTARGGFSILAGVEAQTCFDSARLELLTAPRGEKETWMLAAGLGPLLELLAERGTCSVFCITPCSSIELGAVMLAAGFRHTGLLAGHLLVDGQPEDGLLWSRKLVDPV